MKHIIQMNQPSAGGGVVSIYRVAVVDCVEQPVLEHFLGRISGDINAEEASMCNW
jgi:hypothetical protein